jgi:hypothetical protein
MTDLIFIGEPHLEDNETEEREGYAKLNNGRMVAGYAKTKVLEDIENVTETEHTVTLRLRDGTGITAVYIPPHGSSIKSVTDQDEIIEEIPTNFENHAVIGDTNARHKKWDTKANAYGKRMEEWGRRNKYEILNKKMKTHEESCIDHIWRKGRKGEWKVGKLIGTGKHHTHHTTI